MGLLLHFRFGKLKGQHLPHVGSLQVVATEKQLTGVERAVAGVAYLSIRLNDVLAGGKTFPHVAGDVGKYFGEKGLIVLFKGQPVSVPVEAIDEILG